MARNITRRVVSRFRRIALHSRFFFVTTNLGPGVQPFRTSEYRILVEALGAAREKLTFSLCGYCFMPDHVHAIIMPHERTTISEVLRSFKVRSHPRTRTLERCQVRATSSSGRCSMKRFGFGRSSHLGSGAPLGHVATNGDTPGGVRRAGLSIPTFLNLR